MTDSSSTTGYKVTIGVLAAALVVTLAWALSHKGGGGDEGLADGLRKLQSAFDDCKTQRADLKDKSVRLENDLKRAQEQGANVPACVPGSPITAGRTNVGDGKIGLSVEQIKKVTTQTGGLKMCYERALKRDSSLEHAGRINVTFQFNIHPSGNVGEIGVKAESHIDNQLVDCFKQAVNRWRFPAFEGSPIAIDNPQPFEPQK
jgi:hypothetical protein